MAINKNAILVLFLSVVVLMALPSCSLRALHEAQAVVQQADSLRHEGQMYSDSAALAESYTTLTKWQRFYPDDYARCCYHYGRLLREKDDPVAAMEVFINATHSHTDDLHILGRVYNNMGDIAHRAEDFFLSYDMFKLSADMYRQNGDTLLYYYSLNDMAIELAVQKEKDSCICIINKIQQDNQDSILSAYCFYSAAEAYIKCEQYDSAIYFAHLSKQFYQPFPSTTLQLAQAYSSLSDKDSAVYYAQKVLEESVEPYDINNALYILTNDDVNKDKAAILESAADRSDTQKIIEVQRGKFSQATQILKLDLQRKPDLRWLVAMLGTVFFIGCIVGLYIYRKRKQKALLAQEIAHLETKYNDIQSGKANQLEQICTTLRASENLQKDLCWKDFDKMCDVANQNFFFIVRKLQQSNNLSEREIRLCVLILIGISSSKQLADLLYYAESGIRNFKNRTAKKLDANSTNLRDKLINIAIK